MAYNEQKLKGGQTKHMNRGKRIQRLNKKRGGGVLLQTKHKNRGDKQNAQIRDGGEQNSKSGQTHRQMDKQK